MTQNSVINAENKVAFFSKKHFKKICNNSKTFFSNPSNIILVVFLLALSLMVIGPLFVLVKDTFVVHSSESMRLGLPTGKLTILHWKEILFKKEYSYAKNNFWIPLGNSVGMAIVACLFAVTVGGATAWLITRSNMRFKKFISTIFVFPYIMPSWSIAMFWENFFKNSSVQACQGNVGMLESLTGICVPSGMVYGFWPCAICLGLHYAPFAYILIGGILRNMDANLEEAATILKASRLKILWRVTLPIVMPALLSTILLVFASSVSSYTVPMFLGVNGDFWTLSIKMKSLLGGQYSGQGYVLAVVLILFSVAILTVNQRMTGKRKSFTTVTGKSSQVSMVNLKKAKWPITVFMTIVVAFFAIVPLVSFALESLLEQSGNLSTFTLKYWISAVDTDVYIHPSTGLLRNIKVWKALGGSLGLSLLCALLAGTFGILIGYCVARKRNSKLSNVVSNLAFFPYLIPSMSFGAVYLALSCTSAFHFLYESFFLLVLVGSIKFLPFASRSGTNAMLQVSGEIEEAAVIVGVPWWKRMTRVLFPIQKSSFISGYLLPFISCMRELSLFVLIAPTGMLMTTLLANFETKGLDQMSNGLNLIIILAVLLINFIVNKLTGASIDKGVGGN